MACLRVRPTGYRVCMAWWCRQKGAVLQRPRFDMLFKQSCSFAEPAVSGSYAAAGAAPL